MNGGNDRAISSAAGRAELIQQGMVSFFEDPTFSGDLLTRLFHLGLAEDEMDAIYRRVEDEIEGFVGVLTDAGAGQASREALGGFIQRLKLQILRNPALYVQGS